MAALTSSVPMHVPEATIEIMTDASKFGWSGVLLPHQVHGIWEPEEKLNSMNWMELKTILLVLSEFADFCQGQCIRLFADNTTALACLNRQGSSHSVPLWSLSREILEFCQEREISLVPVHIAGPLNVLADKGSRSSPISTEWSLDRPSFIWACRELGLVPEVDLFATRENAQLPSFVSPCPDPLATAQDSFTVDWNNWSIIYLFPPTSCLARVAVRLLSYRGAGMLIAPLWQYQVWYPLLAQVSEGYSSPFEPLPAPMDFQRRGVLPADTFLEASRLDVVRNSLEKQGYSEDSIRYILNIHKDSTDNRYQFVWSKFIEFLNDNNISHNLICAKDIVNFLSHHASVYNKAYKTIGVYKCAIFTPLYYKFNINLRQNISVLTLCKGCLLQILPLKSSTFLNGIFPLFLVCLNPLNLSPWIRSPGNVVSKKLCFW